MTKWSAYVPIRLCPGSLRSHFSPPRPSSGRAGASSDSASGSTSSAAFGLTASNGFSLDIESEGGKVTIVASERRPPIATFSAAGRPRPAGTGNGASSIYRARGATASPNLIEARLGGLGRISVAFHPSGKVHVTRLDARGRAGACARPARIVRRLGTFTGSIEFEGEDGYTSVRATSARGSVGTPLPPGCAAGRAVLSAVNPRAGTRFEATTTDMGVAFRAILEQRLEGGVVVSRRAYAGAPRGTFAFDNALTSARVSPPAPFSGVARYAAGRPRPGSWAGSLSVTFPGATIPMTGPGFQARLGAGR